MYVPLGPPIVNTSLHIACSVQLYQCTSLRPEYARGEAHLEILQ